MKRVLLLLGLIFSLVNASLAYAGEQVSDANLPDNIKIVKAKGITDDSIARLGNNVRLVSTLIKTKNLSNLQTYNLVNGLLSKSKPAKHSISYSCDLVSPTTNDTITGPHYLIQSKPGYNQSAGFVTLPSVKLKDQSYSAYEILGFYSPLTGCDMGLYSKGDGKWKLCSSLGAPRWQGDLTWFENDKSITLSKVFMVASCYDDGMDIKVFNPAKMSLLDSLYIYAPQRGYNKEGIGIIATREHGLATPYGAAVLSDGSYMHNSSWEKVTIANSTEVSPWGITQTDQSQSGTKDTISEKKCIVLDPEYSTPYTQDRIDVDFNLH